MYLVTPPCFVEEFYVTSREEVTAAYTYAMSALLASRKLQGLLGEMSPLVREAKNRELAKIFEQLGYLNGDINGHLHAAMESMNALPQIEQIKAARKELGV